MELSISLKLKDEATDADIAHALKLSAGVAHDLVLAFGNLNVDESANLLVCTHTPDFMVEATLNRHS